MYGAVFFSVMDQKLCAYATFFLLNKFCKDRHLQKRLLDKPEIIREIAELAFNLLKENVKLGPREKRRLKKFKRELQILIDKKKSNNARIKALVGGRQKGGGPLLSSLLSIGLPILATLIKEKISSSRRRK